MSAVKGPITNPEAFINGGELVFPFLFTSFISAALTITLSPGWYPDPPLFTITEVTAVPLAVTISTVRPDPWAITPPNASAKFIVGTFVIVPIFAALVPCENGKIVEGISLLFPICGKLPVVKLPLNKNPLKTF